MIDLEKQLVQILVEQQRLVLGMVEDSRITTEKAKAIVQLVRMPWPPPSDPTLETVRLLQEEMDRGQEEG